MFQVQTSAYDSYVNMLCRTLKVYFGIIETGKAF